VILDGRTVLVTGGTGSFGRAFIQRALTSKVAKIIVFSRDELKQSEMQKDQRFADARMRYFLGDVRDRERLYRAFAGVDYVVHAAALKQVVAIEYNPIEAKRTNIDGAANVVDAAIDVGVNRVIALSSDKATNPVNAYGASKLFAEKLFTAANVYSGRNGTQFACLRYGNVAGSRGSVIPFFRELSERKEPFPITHPDMTRFWFTLSGAVDLAIHALTDMSGGETYVPKLPSFKIVDLASAINPMNEMRIVGIRPGEKLHEAMIGPDEAHEFYDDGAYFVRGENAHHLLSGFEYTSGSNGHFLDVVNLRHRLQELP
jgi:UDP-N-acetylglucosamine 4,6-dehydratase